MSKFKSLPRQNAACNEIYYQLQACQKEHPVAWFFSKCSPIQKELEDCLKTQHKNRQKASWKRYEERERMKKKAEEAAKENAEQ